MLKMHAFYIFRSMLQQHRGGNSCEEGKVMDVQEHESPGLCPTAFRENREHCVKLLRTGILMITVRFARLFRAGVGQWL